MCFASSNSMTTGVVVSSVHAARVTTLPSIRVADEDINDLFTQFLQSTVCVLNYSYNQESVLYRCKSISQKCKNM